MTKKIAVISVIIGLVIAGTLSAQGIVGADVETLTISGKLAVANGVITVQTGEKTYYAHGFQHLIGFVDGLKEGAEVTLEGFVPPTFRNIDYPNFFALKMTLNGKSYELSTQNGYQYRGMMYGNGYRVDDRGWCNNCGGQYYGGGYGHRGRNYNYRNRW